MAALGSERVRSLLEGLSPDQRTVLTLRVIGDLTVEQVAELIGKRPGAVKQLQRRALAALRKSLDGQEAAL
jgi:RNA polymerase sigma factor (sigma-70 family)